MSDLSIGQESIIKYLKTQYDLDTFEVEAIGNDNIKLTDRSGKATTYTMNLFGDIMEYGTKKIIARSNLPHNLDKIGLKMPNSWRLVES